MEKISAFIKFVTTLIPFWLIGTVQGQLITGRVSTDDGSSLKGAIVNLLHQKDSIFYSFARTEENGRFSLSVPADTGEYFLVFLYPKHTDVAIPLNVSEEFQGKDLGNIKLPLNTVFIEEVVITAKSLMNVRGDTLEYDISGLKLAPNSRVEDVINQLPGMRITRGGQIFSHGKMVERVLVDGEPFFGNDPALVTKNIRSDIVDKIQVYDGASEKEKISGIKDNQKSRTINIELKEDKKKGVFGMAQVGYMNSFYNNMIMLNRFNGNEKIFGYGVLSNTGKLGVGYKNMNSSGGGLGNEFDATTGNYTGEGRPTVYSSGASYSNSWNDHKLNTNVSVKGMTVKGEREVYQFIDNDVWSRENRSSTDFNRTSHEQAFNVDYEKNGMSKLYVSLNGGHERSLDDYRTVSRIDYLEEQGGGTNLRQDNDSREDIFRTDLTVNWSRDLKKEGRRISLGVQPDLMSSSSEIYMQTTQKQDEVQSVKEIKVDGKRYEHNLNFNLSFSEPIFNGSLVSSYENKNYISGNRSDASSVDDRYAEAFGGDFRYNYMINKVRSVYRTTLKKFTSEVGTALSMERFNLRDKERDIRVRKSFVFLQPTVDLAYNWSNNHSIDGRYSRVNIAPLSYLVQPFGDSRDLLNIYAGNTDLDPQTVNSFQLNYHNFKLTKLRAINATFEYNRKYNDIGYSITTGDPQNMIKPVNIRKSTYDYRFSTSFGKEVSQKKDYLWLQLDGSQSLSYNYVNDTENTLRSTSIKFRPSISFKERGGVRFNLDAGPVFERLNYSENNDLNFEGVGVEGSGGVFLSLPFAVRLEQRLNYVYRPQNKLLGTSLNQMLWDISVIKSFGKENMFTAELSVNDLLNQNQGLRRVFGPTGFTENRYSTINRYFLLSFKWDLNRMGE